MTDTTLALLFGGVPQDYLAEWEITSDLDLIERVLGVRFVEVTTDDLLDRWRNLRTVRAAPARAVAQWLLRDAQQPRKVAPPSLDDMVAATRLYFAMDAFVAEHGAQAVGISCRPYIRDEGLPTPCIALSLFQDRGLPAACQSDLDALLSMIVVQRLTGQPTFMGGAIRHRGQLGISHCMTPLRLAGLQAPELPFYLSDYHGRKAGPTMASEVPAGQMATVVRLTPNLERMIVSVGETMACAHIKDRCRNTLVIRVPDRETLYAAVKGTQNHYVVALGDHSRALANYATERGIEPVII